jgi:hypothetical protein
VTHAALARVAGLDGNKRTPSNGWVFGRGSVLVTTSLPFDHWTDVLGSERLTGTLLDRLTHRVHILEMNGESYRFKDRVRRLGKPATRPRPAEAVATPKDLIPSQETTE